MKIHTFTAPSSWASYLINGDASGIGDIEIAACDSWIASIGSGPVDCRDAGFITYHDAREFAPYAADCQEYDFASDGPPDIDHEARAWKHEQAADAADTSDAEIMSRLAATICSPRARHRCLAGIGLSADEYREAFFS